MNWRVPVLWLFGSTVALIGAGCTGAPGKPGPGPEVERPEQLLDFATLYGQNCSACHGAHGRDGAAISLANPVYLATAGVENIQRVTASGVPGTMMPPFAKSAGGMLTDQQIAVIAQGLISRWGNPGALIGQTSPVYASSSPGNSTQGEKTFAIYCARCHGIDGEGITAGKLHTGSLIDPAYLALVSDQGLRSLVIAGQPEQGMPDWRSDMTGAGAHAMTDHDVADIIAWLVSHRIATPGQVYRQQQ